MGQYNYVPKILLNFADTYKTITNSNIRRLFIRGKANNRQVISGWVARQLYYEILGRDQKRLGCIIIIKQTRRINHDANKFKKIMIIVAVIRTVLVALCIYSKWVLVLW